MCGRFALTTPPAEVARLFGIPSDAPPNALDPEALAHPRCNIAPSRPILVIRSAAGARRALRSPRWGLIPSWSDDPSIGNRMINARAETASEKPAFRASFRRRRCVVPADGFYEWSERDAGAKQPYWVCKASNDPRGAEGPTPCAHALDDLLLLAGLWDRWTDPRTGEIVDSAAILTCEANDLLARHHHRMPVALRPPEVDPWLDPETDDAERLAPLLAPRPWPDVRLYPVSTFVNRPSNDDPRCLEPAPEETEGREGTLWA